ncbi:hypothetical protein HK096_000126, partial [Nowakowskiella sp. JEL0078]
VLDEEGLSVRLDPCISFIEETGCDCNTQERFLPNLVLEDEFFKYFKNIPLFDERMEGLIGEIMKKRVVARSLTS